MADVNWTKVFNFVSVKVLKRNPETDQGSVNGFEREIVFTSSLIMVRYRLHSH